MYKSPKEPLINPLYSQNTGGSLKLENAHASPNSPLIHSLPKLIIVLAVLLLPVLLFVVVSVDSASAQMQKWYFSDVDSGLDDYNGETIYVMYKGDDDNNTNDYVTIPDDENRIWVADQAVQVDEVIFEPVGSCFWAYSIICVGADTIIMYQVGGYNSGSKIFYEAHEDNDGDDSKLTIYQGHYLATKITDFDSSRSERNPVNVLVSKDTQYSDHPSYVGWTCDSPPYPVPDIGAWIMFSTGAVLVGFIAWRCRKKLLYSSSLH